MTLDTLIAIDKLRAVWSERHPASQASLGLVARPIVSRNGQRGTGFRWHDYVSNESGFLAFAPEAEACETAQALLDELHRLREQQKKPQLVQKPKAKGAAA